MQTVQMMHEILWLWWKIYSLFIRVQSNKGGPGDAELLRKLDINKAKGADHNTCI